MHSKTSLRILTYLQFEYYRMRTYSCVTWTIKNFIGKLERNKLKFLLLSWEAKAIVFIFFCVYMSTFGRFLDIFIW